MKNIVVTGKRIKIELVTLLVCFIVANDLNLYAIITHDTNFSELFTALGYVFIFSIALYISWSILRLCYYVVKYLFNKNK